MIQEPRTLRVQPDDIVIKSTIERCQIFGWELVSNQRCTETVDGTDSVSVFCKLTFQRPRDGENRSVLNDLEKEYEDLCKQAEGWVTLGNKNVEEYTRQMLDSRPIRPRFSMAKFVTAFIFGIIPCLFYAHSFARRQKQYEAQLAGWRQLPADMYVDNIQKRLKEIETNAKTLRQKSNA